MAKILVVEDDESFSFAIEEMLTFEKHSCEVVNTGTEGWAKAQANQYDLLILDWDLPDLNGINILTRFRKAGGTTPVIMLTGHDSVSDKELGLDSGADDYVTKPFSIDELAARIRAAIRRAESRAPVYKPLGTNNEEVLKRADLAGTLLASRYEFLEILGEGGIGVVFKARQPLMEKLVAIKMLHWGRDERESAHEESIGRFNIEAKAISRLDHHNIITIYDFGVTEQNQPYMVMEYIEGWNLCELIRNEGAIPIRFALDVIIQLCDGMAHAHKAGILHRDLKPANILLKRYEDGPPVVKILDFGLAKLKEQDSKYSIALTRKGQVLGSPMYMSPEQAKGESLDDRSDIYAVGCILYEVLTGCPPHLAKSAVDMMFKHVTVEPKTLHEIRPDIEYPDNIQPVITRAICKDPEQRYQSMRALREDLERIRSGLARS